MAQLNGFGWMAAANAGPGCISVLLEAQALLWGGAAVIDQASTQDVASMRVLRSMVFGQKVRPTDMADFLQVITGTTSKNKAASRDTERFFLRLARDALARPASDEAIMLQQLLLGRGCGPWSSCKLPYRRTAGVWSKTQADVIPDLIDRIETGVPPTAVAAPDAAAVMAGAQRLVQFLTSPGCLIDASEFEIIYLEVASSSQPVEAGTSTPNLDVADVQEVVLSIIRTARAEYAGLPIVEYEKLMGIDEMNDLIAFFKAEDGYDHLAESFVDANTDEIDENAECDMEISLSEFVANFVSIIAMLAGTTLSPRDSTFENEAASPAPTMPFE